MMESLSISIKPETLEALTTEAEMRDFSSRSVYIRHILENRGQIESLDNTEVEVVEAVAERIKESHHEKISEIEDELRGYRHNLERFHDMAEKTRRRRNHIEEFEDELDDLRSSVSSNSELISENDQHIRTNGRDIQENEREIESTKRRVRQLKAEIRELHESNSDNTNA